MKILREYLSFMLTIGMLVLALVALSEQAHRYKEAYQSLSRFISHSSIEVEIKE